MTTQRIFFKQRGKETFALVPASAPVFEPYMVKMDEHNRPEWCDCRKFTFSSRRQACRHMDVVRVLIEDIERQQSIDSLLAEINADFAHNNVYFAD